MESREFFGSVNDSTAHRHSTPKPERTRPVHEWRGDVAYQVAVPGTLREGVDGVVNALEAHRMLFLYLAQARRGIETFDKSTVYGWFELEQLVLSADEYGLYVILKHKSTLDLVEQHIVRAFGPPGYEFPQGEVIPHWEVDEYSCRHLEESANCIFQACEFLVRSTSDSGIESVVRECVDASHAEEQSRWYSLFSVNWSYLGVLNGKLLSLKRFLATSGSYLDQKIESKFRPVKSNSAISNIGEPLIPWNGSFVVVDFDSKKSVLFDPNKMQRFGPFEEENGWDEVELFYHYHHSIFLYVDREGHWTKTTATSHFLGGEQGPPVAERISAEKAVEMLVLNRLPVPPPFLHLVDQHRFKPGAVAFATDADSAVKSKPFWDAESGILTLGGSQIRKVAETAATVRLLLTAFGECEWQSKIDSPFPDDETGKEKLRQTIRSTNNKLLQIEFYSTDNGAAVGWRRVSETAAETDHPF